MFVLGQKLTLEIFQLRLVVVYPIELFSQTWIITEYVESKEKFSGNAGHSILVLYKVYVQV